MQRLLYVRVGFSLPNTLLSAETNYSHIKQITNNK